MKRPFFCLMVWLIFTFILPPWVQSGVLSAYLGGLSQYKEAPKGQKDLPSCLKDYWMELVKKYPYPGHILSRPRLTPRDLDRIPEVYIRRHPFTQEQAGRLASLLAPYQRWIMEASRRFGVPLSIIGGVIIQESNGDPKARAKTTSAKGLMQTIDATFDLAKEALAHQGIEIEDPFNPRDSILAGTWYLAYCFELARQDYPELWNRREIEHWARALEYYYAGPGWGRNPRPIVHVYFNGKRLIIKKGAYSRSVLEMARQLG